MNTLGSSGGVWRPTMANYRSTASGIVLVAAALIFRRPDLLVIATPMVVVTVWSALTRPREDPSFADRIERPTLREGEATSWTAEIGGVDHVDLVTAVTADVPWFERKPRRGAVTAAANHGRGSVGIGVRSTRWGRRLLDPMRMSAVSPWGAFRSTQRSPSRALTTLPLPAMFDSSAPIRPTDGLVGSYRSVRPGEGSEFAGVRSFQAGDKMRRINWSRSLRSEGLQVNSTWADQDTHVALLIDTGDDLGASGGADGLASSLDVTVRAAGAIAEHYVQRGDRVSLQAFDRSPRLALPPATGQRHLRRILDTLAQVNANGSRIANVGANRSLVTAEMIVVFSPLVAPEAIDRVVVMSRLGRSMVVVDTLPDHVADDDDDLTALAWRIRILERRRELRLAQEHGVVIVRWLGPGSLDQFLRDVARRSAAPRVRT